MPTWPTIAYIWLVGLRDLLLSQAMLTDGPAAHELNALARWMIAAFGMGALAVLKMSGLTLYSAAVVMLRRRHRQVSQRLLAAGLLASLALSAWWDLGLLVLPS